MIGGADAAPATPNLFVDAGHTALPLRSPRGRRLVLPDQGGRSGQDVLVGRQRHIRLDEDAGPRPFLIPRGSEVANPHGQLAQELVGLVMRDEPGGLGIVEPRRPEAGLGIERVGSRAERVLDIVLEQAVDLDHRTARKLFATGDALTGDIPAVDHELQV